MIITPVRAEIVLDVSTLERTLYGSVTGVTVLRLDDVCFPAANWLDVPLIVLSWWLDGFCRLLSVSGTSARCTFMDGPFAFRIGRDADDEWSVAPIEQNRERAAVSVDSEILTGSVFRAAEQLLADCTRRGWVGADVDRLRVASEAASGYRAA